jgi:diguanylate cyclase (GGDEF)-like protein
VQRNSGNLFGYTGSDENGFQIPASLVMKRRPGVNLLSGLVLTIVLLGVISAATVFVNARTYRDLAFDFQRQYMAQLLEVRAADILDEEKQNARRLGLSIQSNPELREVFDRQDKEVLSKLLAEQYRHGLVTSDVVRAVWFYVFDVNSDLLAMAGNPTNAISGNGIICPGLIRKARFRKGSRRLKPLSELCLSNGIPYLAVLVPVGGPIPTGYLQIVSDPVPGLGQLAAGLRMPIQVTLLDGSVQYQSAGWVADEKSNTVKSEYVLSASDSYPALKIEAERNASHLVTQIDKTNNRLLLVVVLFILVTVIFALLMVKYSVFKPLQDLSYMLSSSWIRGRGRKSDVAAQDEGGQPVSFHALGELYETLHDMAIRDPLTGTYNRALLEDRIKQLFAEHRRTPGSAAILLIDMVRFKYVNDLLGHHTGDLLLKDVVVRIAQVLRESDTLARLGGDEFVVILPDTDESQAIQVAQKIVQSMDPEFDVEGHKLSASVSIGIAMTPEHGEDVDVLLRNADYAMYSVKNTKLGYAVYDPATIEDINDARMTLDGVLNEDIERNDLFLVYQPVMDYSAGQVSYLEALVRWRQPDGQIRMPESFIRVAEQSGLIKQLSEWVIDTACRELASLQKEYPGLRMGINLSMHDLHDFNLKDYFREILGKYGLQSQSLLLEITETGVMLDPEQVIEILGQLSAIGFQLSIDDFGTGNSSLVYLKRLPVNTLKVDKSFVVDMDVDEDNAAIVRATIDLAHSLGLTVTAEGIESRSVRDQLQAMGCDYFQGYFISKPMDGSDLPGWLSGSFKNVSAEDRQ